MNSKFAAAFVVIALTLASASAQNGLPGGPGSQIPNSAGGGGVSSVNGLSGTPSVVGGTNIDSVTPSGSSITINAHVPESYCSFGVSAAVANGTGPYAVCKTVVAVTVDNIEVITGAASGPSSFQFVVQDCGTASACASPTTIGSVVASNTGGGIVDGTVTTAAVAAGHYVRVVSGTGSCTVCAYGGSVAWH